MNPISTPLETQMFLAARSYLYGGTLPWSHLERDPHSSTPRRPRSERRRSDSLVRAVFRRKPVVAAEPSS